MKHVSYRARAHLPRLRTRTIMALNIENTILNVSNHHEILDRMKWDWVNKPNSTLLGEHLEESWPIFFQWYRSSSIRVQIGREFVRLITLVCLNKFLIKLIFLKRLKKFYGRLFDALSSENTHFWCFIGLYKQFYLL